MKRVILLTVLVSVFVVWRADAQDTLWTRTYGGSGQECAFSVQQTTDGGYIVVGSTPGLSGNWWDGDFYLVKTDASGDTVWTRTYGGDEWDGALSVQQTTDGGYIVLGSTESFGPGLYDFYLMKTDAYGDTVWTRTYGDIQEDWPGCVRQTSDGGYVLAGETASFGAFYAGVYLVKTDPLGDTLWTRTHKNYFGCGASWVEQTTDGGYIVAGYVGSVVSGWSDDNFYLVKTNSAGDTLWTRTYDGGGPIENARCVQQTTDGGYIVAGETRAWDPYVVDFYVVKTDASGDTLWTRTYRGSGRENCYVVRQTTDGGYVLAGSTNSFGAGGADFYLVKTDASGDTLWTRTYGGSSGEVARGVEQTTDGGYVLAGTTTSYGAGDCDFYLVKIAGDLQADVSGVVSSPNGGLQGVPVDLVGSDGELHATTITDESGYYYFDGVPGGDYTISVATPLGYAADVEWQEITVAGEDLTADFYLVPVEISYDQRSAGFWKHQPCVYVSGRGNPQIREEEFSRYLDNIGSHFNTNPTNPITLYTVEPPGGHMDSLEAANVLLGVRGNVAMVDRAKRQLMALLLNVVSEKLPQFAPISDDDATVSQAITYCWDLITPGGDYGENHELAKDIADQINSNLTVAAWVIPDTIPDISYKVGVTDDITIPVAFGLSQNYPNPFNAKTTIDYQLPATSDVKLEVYNLLGERLAILVDEKQEAGYRSAAWDASDVSSGLYFYKLTARDFTETRRMILVK